MAASNINIVAITGNSHPRPRAPLNAERDLGLQASRGRQQPPQGRLDRRVGRQAQLLRRHRLGRAGRELRQLPLEGPAGGRRGRLDWREWEAQDGSKRQAVEIIANSVQFLGSRSDNQGGGGGGNGFQAQSDVPADTSDFEGATASSGGGSDDDIPF